MDDHRRRRYYEIDEENSQKTATASITRTQVYISGLTAKNRAYNGSFDADLVGTPVLKRVSNDAEVQALSVNQVVAQFDNKNAGQNKAVSITSGTLNNENDYILELDKTNEKLALKADIYSIPVTVKSGITAENKTYNGNTDAVLNFTGAVFDGKADGDVLTVSGTGTFADANAGTGKTVTITGLTLGGTDSGNYVLAESGNQETATAAISKATTENPASITKEYLYSKDNADSLTLTGLPEDCGTVSWNTPTTTGSLSYAVEPTVTNTGELSYTVQNGTKGATGTVSITAQTQNYNDITFTVSITLVDRIPVKLKDGASVTLTNNILTYGQKLSELQFNSAEFVSDDEEGNPVAGTLAWKEPDTTPDAVTTSAVWVFTPNDSSYASAEGTVEITVNKATPVVGAPTATEITYGQTLNKSSLSGGSATLNGTDVPGSFEWEDGTVRPAVSDSDKTEYTVIFTPDDQTNLNSTTCKVRILVNKVDIPVDKITAPVQKTPVPAYDGTGKELISAGSVSENFGTMWYAVTGSSAEAAPDFDGDSQSADKKWSTSIPTATNAGTYKVWYMVKGVGNYKDTSPMGPVEVKLEKGVYPEREAAASARYGTSGMLELKKYLAEGGTCSITVSDPNAVISENAVPALDGTMLRWSFKDDSSLAGKKAIVIIHVTDAKNYRNYDLEVTLSVTACTHSRTELRDAREGTCSGFGYSGDRYCLDCGAMIEKGKATDKDPDNHHFDFNDESHKKVKQTGAYPASDGHHHLYLCLVRECHDRQDGHPLPHR